MQKIKFSVFGEHRQRKQSESYSRWIIPHDLSVIGWVLYSLSNGEIDLWWLLETIATSEFSSQAEWDNSISIPHLPDGQVNFHGKIFVEIQL